MVHRMSFLTVVVLVAMSCPTRALAWGKDGHEIVGKIAEKHLDKRAREAVEELLKDHQFKSLSDTKLVNWADAIRSSATYKEKYPKAPMWHWSGRSRRVRAIQV